MIDSKKINALGQILETSWGKSSQGYNCTAKFEGNLVRVTYSTVVYLASERSTQAQIPPIAREALERIKSRITSAKKDFSDLTGDSLKLKEVNNDESVEYIQATSVTPRKVALYRRFVDFEVS